MSAVDRTKIVAVVDEMTALGLHLAGIQSVAALHDEETGYHEILHFANDETVAVMIITEFYAEQNQDILARIARRPWPVIVEIPGPEGKITREESTLKALVRDALGIEIEI